MIELILIIIFLSYVIIVFGAALGIQKISTRVHEANAKNTHFSLLIPFRNEAHHLSNLLSSLEKLDYPKTDFEIILINDSSEDEYLHQIKPFISILELKLIDLENYTGKKRALEAGIRKSQFDYIITLDADCIVPENLLQSYSKLIKSENSDFIIGSVNLSYSSQFIQKFQFLDFLAMQGVGFGWANLNYPILCSGANLCYSKSVFLELNPFDDNWDIPSGDDIFTLLSFKKSQKKISTNLEAVVISKSLIDWKSVYQQRKRWLSKNSKLKDSFYTLVSLIIFITNACLLVLIGLSFFNIAWLEYWFIGFVLKFLFDYYLLYQIAYHLKQFFCWQDILKVSLIYPLVLVYTILSSVNLKYIWKNRIYNGN